MGFEVGSIVRAVKNLSPEVKRGDEGIIVGDSGGLSVKFIPFLPGHGVDVIFGAQPPTVPYRFEHSVDPRSIRLQIEQTVMEKVSGAGSKRQAEILIKAIARREQFRCSSVPELLDRLLRLADLMDPAASTSADFAKYIVSENFMTEQERDDLARLVLPNLKMMRFPWDAVSSKKHRILLTHGSAAQAVEKVIDMAETERGGPLSSWERAIYGRGLRAMTLWARSRRQLIRVSEASQRTLFELAVERVMYGLPVAIWGYLPAVGASMVHHGEGIMFQWERSVVDEDGEPAGKTVADLVTFSAPRGDVSNESLDFLMWKLQATRDLKDAQRAGWEHKGWSSVWAEVPWATTGPEDWPAEGEPGYQDPSLLTDTNVNGMVFDWAVRAEVRTLVQGGMGREEAVRTALADYRFVFIHMTVNLIAALHNFSETVVKRPTHRLRKKGKRDRNALSVKQVTLDDTGLYTWATTWAQEQAVREAGHGDREGVTIGLHKRSGTDAFVWVRTENLLPGEKVYEVKEGVTKKDGKVTYHKVKRAREGGYAGHGPLKPRTLRIRKGLDDMDVFSNNAVVTGLRDLLT
jgi:hypothetical protein